MGIEVIQHTGFHSSVYRTELNGREAFLKEYGIKAGGYDLNQALGIAADMRRFVKIAQGAGVRVVEPVGFYISKNGHPGKACLIECVPSAGRDLRARFEDPHISDSEAREDIRAYLDLYRLVWNKGFPISLDPPPANFARNGEGEVWYIDCMPPRHIRDDGTKISEWPTPPNETREFIENRYFSPQQSQVIYPQLLRAVQRRKSITPWEIKEMIGRKLGDEAYARIDFSNSTQKEILDNPNPQDVDVLRIIAAERYFEGKISGETIAEIYHLTHIKNGGILPEAKDLVSLKAKLEEKVLVLAGK